ncbi:hypothetical protein J7L06_01530 [Candidatus Bathyarchaeota archaeon]|nr:hypothetical protein [Candidatus Bathyarchaeota archaeon]
MSEKMEMLTLRVPQTVKLKLAAIAQAEGVTVSDIVRRLIETLHQQTGFLPLTSVKLQKMLIASHIELLKSLYVLRGLTFAILTSMRKDLTDDLKEMWAYTLAAQKTLREVEDALKREDWDAALKRLLARVGDG